MLILMLPPNVIMNSMLMYRKIPVTKCVIWHYSERKRFLNKFKNRR